MTPLKQTIFFFLFIIFSSGLSAQDWRSDYIWSEEEGSQNNPPVTYFRKSFELGKVPETAYIAATGCRFKLYVNGEYVGEGVPQNVARRSYYVRFEVSEHLLRGENVVAVESQSVNPSQFSGIPPLFSARLEAGELEIETDQTWKVLVSPAWGKVEGHSSGIDFIEVYNSPSDPIGWKEPDFDDSEWKTATVLTAEVVRYNSVDPAVIPNFKREELFPVEVAKAGEVVQILGNTQLSVALQMATETLRPIKYGKIINHENLLKATAVTTIEPQVYVDDLLAYDTWWEKYGEMPIARDVSFILDFGAIRNAYIALDAEGNRDATIDVAWGQALIDGQVQPVTYSRRHRDAAGRPDHQYALRWILSGGRQQFESMNYKSFRYLQVTVRDLTEPLKIFNVNAIHSYVTVEPRGRFSCSDEFLTELFPANLRTLKAASYDVFMDNTIREKAIWGGDICDGVVPTSIAGYGDNPMLRVYIDLFAHSQAKDGSLPMLAGRGNPPQLIVHPIHNAIWMAEYGLWCEDEAYFKNTILPVLQKYHGFWQRRLNENGLITRRYVKGRPGVAEHTFIDWSVDWSTSNWQRDFPPGPGTVLLPWNLLYVRFLLKLAPLLEEPESRLCLKEAQVICDWIFANCWDEQRGLYIDGYSEGKPVYTFSEHANFMALACGLGIDGRAERILQALPEMKPGKERIVRCQAPFSYWPFEGLFNVGADRIALELMDERYSRFTLYDGILDCFWEEYSYLLGASGWHARYRSLAQNGAGSPAYHFLTNVLGVKPVRPGFAEFEIKPQPGNLEWAEGIVPSPRGDIPIRFEKKNGNLNLETTIPEGTTATLIRPDGSKKRLKPGKRKLTLQLK